MHYRSEHTRAGRDWRGLPNGGVRIEPASYNCSTYMNKRKVFEHECSSHFIQEKVIEQIILETIRYACQSVRLDENAFAEAMRSASAIRDEAEIKKIKSALEKQEKRYGELDLLIKKVYEDNALGKLSDKRYEILSQEYEEEQVQLTQTLRECKEQLAQYESDTDRTEEFLALVHKYTDITELKPVIINEFVDKVLVHKAEKIDGERVVEIEVYLNFIGKVNLPTVELSEEEQAELTEKKRIRERNAMYQRKRREKFMPKTKEIRSKVSESEKQEQLAVAKANAQKLLDLDEAGVTDQTERIAGVAAGENKIVIESGILPTEAEVKEKYAI